jgi:folate-binding protein YgfZ
VNEAGERAARVRRGAGWFERPDRGVVIVRGGDRVRWLQGMLSNDVASLSADPTRSGCYALLLTPQGRIAADMHVLHREAELWLEMARDAVPDVMARLDRLLIADDVTLTDAGDTLHHAAFEGPRATEIMARAAGGEIELAPDCGTERVLGGVEITVGAWGWSGEPAYQLIAPREGAGAVRDAVLAAAGEEETELADLATLEVLRVEAGTPRLGAELGLDVLPAEAGLVGRAVSLKKGSYTGQEIVARMDSRDAVAHRLVGIVFDDAVPVRDGSVAVGTEVLSEDGTRWGELTSVCLSEIAAPIGLGYVRRAHAAPGLVVRVGGAKGRIAPLPFVRPGT